MLFNSVSFADLEQSQTKRNYFGPLETCCVHNNYQRNALVRYCCTDYMLRILEDLTQTLTVPFRFYFYFGTLRVGTPKLGVRTPPQSWNTRAWRRNTFLFSIQKSSEVGKEQIITLHLCLADQRAPCEGISARGPVTSNITTNIFQCS